MLAEGFLRLLLYREERKITSASKRHKTQTRMEPFDCNLPDSTDPERDSSDAGPNQEATDCTQAQALKAEPNGARGLSIPGRLPVFAMESDLMHCMDNCSFLEQYPDLQVADSGCISHNQLRATVAQHGQSHHHPEALQEPQGGALHSIPDQGYLVMGASVNVSLDVPGLEPMSNSVLNGLLEKQLEEVYLQHLTENLARYSSSHPGSSLLHGLVPPPQPCGQQRGPDSLEPSLDGGSGEDKEKKISYLNTQNLVPCSSNFSTPVLRISATENNHPQ